MLLLIALAAGSSPPPTNGSQATAVVRVLRGVRATRAQWEKGSAGRRREIVRAEDGRIVKIRLIEFE